jgi:hypothetical protein
MMKTNSILSILYVLLFCGSISGKTEVSSVFKNQGLFTDTTDMSALSVWRYAGIREYTSPPWVIEVKVIGDTLIDGKLCRVLGSWFEGIFQEDSPLPVFYKDKRMSFYEDGQFWPMYDFNLNVGDSMVTYLSKNAHTYSLGGGSQESTDELRLDNPYKAIVLKIDSVETSDGRKLKRLTTYREKVNGMKDIVQDIGSENGLFGFFIITTADVGWYEFLCYKNESYVFPDENSCSPTSSSDVDKYNFIVSPNPVSDILQINLGEYIPEQGFLQITDATGRQVLRQKLMSGLHSIDMSALPPGLYFWTAEDNGVKMKGGKVVKI